LLAFVIVEVFNLDDNDEKTIKPDVIEIKE